MNNIKQLNKQYAIPISRLCGAVDIPRCDFYRAKINITSTKQIKVNKLPANKLKTDDSRNILDLLHSEEFVDTTPYHVFYTMLDKGLYYCSIRTMYRLLKARSETQERRRHRRHRDAVKPELVATRHNEVWSWDITKLLSTRRLVYYYLYVVLDIYSRYVVGWMLAEKECKHFARKLIQTTALKQGIQRGQLTLHSDNGSSMRSGTVSELLEYIGIIKSHNRPYTSNDNPFSESQFKTLKYCPQFPERFENIKTAEAFCQRFFDWYNCKHYHSGIQYLRPHDVHYGNAKAVLKRRHNTLLDAYYANPLRFNNKVPKERVLMPVYINPPNIVEIQDGLEVENMA